MFANCLLHSKDKLTHIRIITYNILNYTSNFKALYTNNYEIRCTIYTCTCAWKSTKWRCRQTERESSQFLVRWSIQNLYFIIQLWLWWKIVIHVSMRRFTTHRAHKNQTKIQFIVNAFRVCCIIHDRRLWVLVCVSLKRVDYYWVSLFDKALYYVRDKCNYSVTQTHFVRTSHADIDWILFDFNGEAFVVYLFVCSFLIHSQFFWFSQHILAPCNCLIYTHTICRTAK